MDTKINQLQLHINHVNTFSNHTFSMTLLVLVEHSCRDPFTLPTSPPTSWAVDFPLIPIDALT